MGFMMAAALSVALTLLCIVFYAGCLMGFFI